MLVHADMQAFIRNVKGCYKIVLIYYEVDEL